MSDQKDDFTCDGDVIEGFTAKCERCGSSGVKVEYEFNYYGGYAGYNQSLSIECKNCGQTTDLSI